MLLLAWAVEGHPLRLIQRIPKPQETQQALVCYGAARHDTDRVYLEVGKGSPKVSQPGPFYRACWLLPDKKECMVVVIWDLPVGIQASDFGTGSAPKTSKPNRQEMYDW